jgi:hypothetical protein
LSCDIACNELPLAKRIKCEIERTMKDSLDEHLRESPIGMVFHSVVKGSLLMHNTKNRFSVK